MNVERNVETVDLFHNLVVVFTLLLTLGFENPLKTTSLFYEFGLIFG